MAVSFERVALGFLFAVVAAGSIAAAVAPSLEFGGRLDGVVQSSAALVAQPPEATTAIISLNTQGLDPDAVAAAALVPRPMGWPPPHGAAATMLLSSIRQADCTSMRA